MKIIIIFFLTATFISCAQKNNSNVEKKENVEINFNENKSIKEILESLKTGMIDYLQYADNEYSIKDVENCINLIENFVENISKSKSKIEGLKLIDEVVIQLNELNNKCGGRLIETGQREDICHIIIKVGFEKGYNLKNEDTTEKLRDW